MMNSIVGRFHLEEVDGKQYLVHHLDSPGEQSMDLGNTDNNYLSVSTLFLCPTVRFASMRKRVRDLYREEKLDGIDIIELDSSPYFNGVIQENESADDKSEKERLDLKNHDHYVLPVFWCKNEDGFDYNSCGLCDNTLRIGTDFYFCVTCDAIFHKECVESPLEIKHPYHPNHPLKLLFFKDNSKRDHWRWNSHIGYHCTLCNVSMDIACAMKSILFVIEKTKRHDHPLTFFTRKDHLGCNVCGLINKNHHTYICLKCNFVVHQDCVDFPSVIRISRHHHRISFTSSLAPGKWSCGVCRKDVDSDYGAYTCNKCDRYVVHSKCALRKDVWDGKELEGTLDEDDIEEVLDPFERINDGSIIHFLHKHSLKRETIEEVYDENKICHACVLPIYEGDFYSCIECDFILHDSCANAPRKKQHPLHPHPLTLKIASGYDKRSYFKCDACYRSCSGFVYEHNIGENYFRLDVRCGSISEPFVYQGHAHPLFLALDPQERHLCQVCLKDDGNLINCIECDFIICLKCVNLPYMVRYKYDKHFLTLAHGKEIDGPDWCQVCERLLISFERKEEDEDEYIHDIYRERKGEDENEKRFYQCKQCCTTLHIKCLLGKTPYMKPGHTVHSGAVQILPNNSLSRPSCEYCRHRCVDKIFFKLVMKRYKYIYCCLHHTPVY